MAGYADFFAQRPGLPGPMQSPFDQMLQDFMGRKQGFERRFPRTGEQQQAPGPQQPRGPQQLAQSLQQLGGRF